MPRAGEEGASEVKNEESEMVLLANAIDRASRRIARAMVGVVDGVADAPRREVDARLADDVGTVIRGPGDGRRIVLRGDCDDELTVFDPADVVAVGLFVDGDGGSPATRVFLRGGGDFDFDGDVAESIFKALGR